MERIEIANNLATAINGRVWTTTKADGTLDKVRVYADKGYAEINTDGVNVDKVGRNQYEAAKAACAAMDIKTYRR